jgi:hypothetical protein
MSEADLLSIVRDGHVHMASLFGQIISINLAMIIGIYYFLRRSTLGFRLFAYVVYLIGMFMFFGLLVFESNVLLGAVDGLRAFPGDHLSAPARHVIALSDSWVGTTSSLLGNAAFWVLLIGVTYLLFFWKDQPEKLGEPDNIPAGTPRSSE